MWKTIFVLGYKVVAKGYHEASGMGIFGSNISKLEMYKGAKQLLHFDQLVAGPTHALHCRHR